MQQGDHIKIKKELNTLGKFIFGVLGGVVVYNRATLLPMLFAVGTSPFTAVPLILSIVALRSSLSKKQQLVFAKLSKGELFYEHHGIFVNKTQIIHEPGAFIPFSSSRIEYTNMKDFGDVTLKGLPIFNDRQSVQKVHHRIEEYSGSETVKRARKWIGKEIKDPNQPHESGYNLTERNCEHFATWCKTGEWRSAQIDKAFSIPPPKRIEKSPSVKESKPKKTTGKIQTRQDVVEWCQRLRKGKQRKALCPFCGVEVKTANMVQHFDKAHK